MTNLADTHKQSNSTNEDAEQDLKQLSWTGDLVEDSLDGALKQLCSAFNNAPFMSHNFMHMEVAKGHHIECIADMRTHLIGNVTFKILHGGVAATMLDSIGGIQSMAHILIQEELDFKSRTRSISRLATVDLRVDYLVPGKGERFVASAEVIRLGRKSCTCRMQLINETGKLIAVGTGSYAF